QVRLRRGGPLRSARRVSAPRQRAADEAGRVRRWGRAQAVGVLRAIVQVGGPALLNGWEGLMTPTIRPETTADHEANRHRNRLAVGQDEEAGIVDALRSGGYARVSLVAEVGGVVVGHILFSDLPILTDNGTVPALSLAPMAVVPKFQRWGVGSALVQKG